MEDRQKSCFMQNRECEYFPCHPTDDLDKFNCLFCYCPLYALGDKCGGNFTYTSKGVKSCKNCTIPHTYKGYDYVMSKYPEIADLACRKDDKQD